MRIPIRALLLMSIDALLISAAFFFALWLRFDGRIPSENLTAMFSLLPVVVLLFPVVFYYFRLYHHLWAYASVHELLTIVRAITVAMALFVLMVYLLPSAPRLPRSIYLIGWVLGISLVGSSRLSWRVLREALARTETPGNPILIFGAGDAGAMVVRELQQAAANTTTRVVGFIDDDLRKQGMILHGLPVLGTRQSIPELVAEHQIREIIIAIPSVPGAAIREILAICQEAGVKARILPGMHEIIDGKVSFSKIREVELEDLLRREPVSVDIEEIAGYLHDQTVLVTGAGGSIGSELCRQVARYRPRQLLLLEHSENNLYEIDLELQDRFPGLNIVPLLADVKDQSKLNYLFERYRPSVVFHAAAHKHVPMMEYNPEEAIKNNVIGTWNLAEAADRGGVRTMIFISTDKAVNPTSIMGASKRVAEKVVTSLNLRSRTCFAAVRFGNVLGSNGSVVPRFKRQIARGGPVTVTHPEMQRYFMTIPEAVQLVIQAGAMARGGEVFVLDMGEPVKIVDMARDLIRLSGFKPDEEIEIRITGIRPGEKLFEELLTAEEGTAATCHQRIFTARQSQMVNIFDTLAFQKLNKAVADSCPEKKEIVFLLHELIPTFRPGGKKLTPSGEQKADPA